MTAVDPLPTPEPAPEAVPEIPPEEKIKRGIKFTEEEKKAYREKLKAKETAPVTLEELEAANDKILKRIIGEVGSMQKKDLPKMLEIVRTAITERKARGEKGKDDTKPPDPTRKEMLEALQGRKLEAKA